MQKKITKILENSFLERSYIWFQKKFIDKKISLLLKKTNNVEQTQRSASQEGMQKSNQIHCQQF